MSSDRAKPVVTPWTMLATSVRVRPCSWRERRESLGRSTRTSPLSTVTFISRSSFCETFPLGPSTLTRPGCALTFTLSGILMMSLPMRDMVGSLPDGGDELAAEVLLARLAIDENALGGGEDGDAQAVHDLWDLGVPHVAAQPRFRLALDLADGRPLALVVLEDQVQGSLDGVLLDGDLADEALLAQHVADALLDLAGGEIELLEPRALCVADPRQQIGNRIGHAHLPLPPPAVPVGAPAPLPTLDYQDDLITPVISPFRARLRKQMRHIWNLLRNARLRPHSSQREYARTLNFGFFCRRLACAILESLAILMTPLRRSRGSREVGGSRGGRAPPLWRRRKAPDRRAFRRGTRFRAASSCRPEGHAHVAEQSATLFVAPRRGHDGDVHALDLLDPVVVDLGEDDLLLDAERVVALPVERLARHALEVAHAGEGDVQQPVEELVHPVLAQGGHHADGLVLAQLEVGDALARAGDDALLTGDGHHLLLGLLDQLVVGDGLAQAHVHHHLLDLGHLHHVLVAEVLHQGRDDLLLVGRPQPRSLLAARLRLALRGLDGGRGLLLPAPLLLLLATRLGLGVRLGVRHRPFAVGVLLRLLLFRLLLFVGHVQP